MAAGWDGLGSGWASIQPPSARSRSGCSRRPIAGPMPVTGRPRFFFSAIAFFLGMPRLYAIINPWSRAPATPAPGRVPWLPSPPTCGTSARFSAAPGTYRIMRFFQDRKYGTQVVVRGLTLEQARAHCSHMETSSSTPAAILFRQGLKIRRIGIMTKTTAIVWTGLFLFGAAQAQTYEEVQKQRAEEVRLYYAKHCTGTATVESFMALAASFTFGDGSDRQSQRRRAEIMLRMCQQVRASANELSR